MPKKIERDASDGTLEQELQRERREHALIDEEKLGMDELEEERLRRELASDDDGSTTKK
ncbi:hypothetical protein [Janthinobacterium sp. HLX7-2]|uniref:hypothetical protein n=1 Tax=Janthinobacterium sp. HLX7-2 TaxID=1259331 RepID=UPI003F26BFAC